MLNVTMACSYPLDIGDQERRVACESLEDYSIESGHRPYKLGRYRAALRWDNR